jgi:hypothetical protein
MSRRLHDLKIQKKGEEAHKKLEGRLAKRAAAKKGGSRRKSRKGRKSRKAKRRTAKVGSKSNPYKNKTACMKGRRSGKVFFKRKGRVVSMKKKK